MTSPGRVVRSTTYSPGRVHVNYDYTHLNAPYTSTTVTNHVTPVNHTTTSYGHYGDAVYQSDYHHPIEESVIQEEPVHQVDHVNESVVNDYGYNDEVAADYYDNYNHPYEHSVVNDEVVNNYSNY